MDHLPYPSDPLLPPIRVPLIVSDFDSYDGLGFFDFPIRRGWASSDGKTKWYHCEAEVALCRAQSWLYFGLLHEFLGHRFKRDDFIGIDDPTGEVVVTTKCLPHLLRNWSGSIVWPLTQYTSREMLAGFLEYPLLFGIFDSFAIRLRTGTSRLPHRIKLALVTAQEECKSLSNHHLHCSSVTLSIMALLWSLRNAASNKDLRVLQHTELPLSLSRLIRHRMLQAGFCPFWLKNWEQHLSVATLYYLSALQHPGELHQHCSDEYCTANQIDENTYETQHASVGCDCTFVQIDSEQVTALIRAGEVPLIRITSSITGAVNVEVVRATIDNPFVAISHVWASGMGNPHDLALPNCQLLRILRLAALPDPNSRRPPRLCTIWIDTLCLPTRFSGEILRRQAINQMTRIYSEAKSTLVLDQDLRSIGADAPDERRLVVLLTSAWMTRC